MSTNDNPRLSGAGPWSFSPEEPIPVGDPWRLDLRYMTYRGQPRYFQPFLPMDDVSITNRDTAAVLDVEYNGLYESVVEPNQTRGFGAAGVVSITITNRSTNPAEIQPEALSVEVATEGVTADSAARREAQQHPLGRVVENFTGIDPISGRWP